MEVVDQVSEFLASVVGVFQDYGWYILIVSLILIYIYNKFVFEKLAQYKEYKFEQEYAAKYHKNPDLFSAHQTAQQRWAEKMQEKLKAESEEFQQKLKEKEERKKQEILEKYGAVMGRSGKKDENKDGDAKSSSLKTDYNPLMGGGSSSNYRPPKRSACGGGGCGR